MAKVRAHAEKKPVFSYSFSSSLGCSETIGSFITLSPAKSIPNSKEISSTGRVGLTPTIICPKKSMIVIHCDGVEHYENLGQSPVTTHLHKPKYFRDSLPYIPGSYIIIQQH